MAEAIPDCKCPSFPELGENPFYGQRNFQQLLENVLWLHSVLCSWSSVSPFGKGNVPHASQGKGEVFHTAM